MDFDLPKVVLIVLAVLPGYLALRGSDQVIPRTQRKKGATEEVAEFLIFSIIAHCSVALVCGLCWMFLGLIYKGSAVAFIGEWFQFTPSQLLKNLEKVPALSVAAYLIFTLPVGWFVGLSRGLFESWHPIEGFARKLGLLDSPVGRFWSRHVERFLITDRPVIYDALFPDVDENGEQKIVFAELVLREGEGSITGRVASFSIANDEENHKLIYLEEVYRRKANNTEYEKLDIDGVLIDLADAIILQIKQV